MAHPLAVNPPLLTVGFPGTIFVKLSVDIIVDGQGTKWRRKIAENFNRLSRAHKRYRQTKDSRQTTDGRVTAYSERAKN